MEPGGEHLSPPQFGGGRYVVRQRVGSGAFAVVYDAFDELLDVRVAVKVLAENWAVDPDVRMRFIQEARLLRAANHPGIVRVHDIGTTGDGRPFFVMDFADRGTLADRLRALEAAGHRVRPADVAVAMAAVAEAVQGIHDLGYVHRDIKPSNLLLSTDRGAQVSPGSRLLESGERLLLSDLGMAKDLAAGSGLTVGGGTAGYMAPEQVTPGRGVDRRTDVFALSALTAELLGGEPASAELRFDDGRPVGRTELSPAITPSVRRFLAGGLDIEPERRPPTAAGWHAGLVGALDADGAVLDTGRDDAAAAISLPPLPPERRRSRTLFWWATAGVVAMAAVLAVVIVVDRSGGTADDVATDNSSADDDVDTGESAGDEPAAGEANLEEGTIDDEGASGGAAEADAATGREATASEPTVIAPRTVGAGEKSYVYTVAPEGADVRYTFEGQFYDGPELWIRADEDTEELAVLVTAGDGEVLLDQTLRFDVIDRPASQSACSLITDGELVERLGVQHLNRSPLGVGNLCSWNIRGVADGTVVVGRHREESAEALLAWFTNDVDSSPVAVPGADEARIGVVEGKRRLMASGSFGLVEVELGSDLEEVSDASFTDVAELALSRLDPDVAAPAVGCGLLSDSDVYALLGQEVTQTAGATPDVCEYTGAGLQIHLTLYESFAAEDLDQIIGEDVGDVADSIGGVEMTEVQDLGDRALLVDAGPGAALVVAQDGAALQVIVVRLGDGDVVADALALAEHAVRRL